MTTILAAPSSAPVGCDVLVIGAGIAGASAAALLADDCDVIVLEREPWPGYHSTGRSAAVYIENYGNATIRRLNRASRALLAAPPSDFSERPFLGPRGEIYIADAGRLDNLQALRRNLPGLQPIAPDEVLRRVPALRPAAVAGALYEPNAFDLDVHALHQSYLKRLRRRGGRLICDAGVSALAATAGRWRATTAVGTFEAPVLVNAAGAWADTLAGLAGLSPLGLTPLRRTAALLPLPPDSIDRTWPTICDVDDRFYCKPDAGRLLLSPVEETPALPQDAGPDELALAHGIDAFEQAFALEVTRVEHRWAGLRTFAPDHTPVVGYDPDADGFFWLAGQGGYGIQTSPAMAGLAASLVRRAPLPESLLAEGFDPAEVAPARFR